MEPQGSYIPQLYGYSWEAAGNQLPDGPMCE